MQWLQITVKRKTICHVYNQYQINVCAISGLMSTSHDSLVIWWFDQGLKVPSRPYSYMWLVALSWDASLFYYVASHPVVGGQNPSLLEFPKVWWQKQILQKASPGSISVLWILVRVGYRAIPDCNVSGAKLWGKRVQTREAWFTGPW